MRHEQANSKAHADAVVWRPYFITTPFFTSRCTYWHTETNGIVLVVDRDGPKSVTNDAERVVLEMYKFYYPRIGGEFRLLYRDTQGDWAELKHVQGVFTGFAFPTDHKANLAIAAIGSPP